MPLGARLSPFLDGKALAARLRGRAAPLGARHVVGTIALVVAVALAQVYLRLQVIEGGYAISRESRLRRDLEDQNQKLRLELATRRDPATIERRAREELHMAPPDPAAIRTVRLESGVGPGVGRGPGAVDPHSRASSAGATGSR